MSQSSLVQLAYKYLDDATAPDAAAKTRDFADRVVGVIENHSGLPAQDKDALKIAALLYLAKADQNSALSENQLEITFGKKVADAVISFKAQSITDESKIVDGSAVVMAVSAARMEGTLAKLSNPATFEDGVKETGGKKGFGDYAIGLTEERLWLSSYAKTPALLKYEMKLLGLIDEKLSPAATVAAPAMKL